MIDGTPHDWFENGKKFSLHLAIDDATGKHTIFKSLVDGNLTQFRRMCEELGINIIFAETVEAKGKAEKKNLRWLCIFIF